MYLEYVRFSVMILILAIFEKSHSSSISFSNPDKKQVNDAFAELLDSLIRVNEERVDALNKFFKLNDFHVAHKMLRNGHEVNREPIVALIVADQDKNIKNHLQIDNRKSDLDSDGSDSSSDNLTEERDDPDGVQLRIRKIKDLDESKSSDEVVSTEKKAPYNYTDTILTDSSLEGGKIKPRKGIQLSRCKANSYRDCYSACKEAYRHSCIYYICSRSLYRRLKKECRSSCRYRFY